MTSPRVAVVLVSYNEGGFLQEVLPALEAQTVRPARTIVVWNKNDDGSAEMVAERFPHVERVVMPEPSGFAVANNVGIRMADDCEWVALLNPDAFPEPDWLETLLRSAADRPDFAVFGPKLRRAREPGMLDGTGDMYHVAGLAWRRDNLALEAESAAADVPAETFSASAAAALYRRDALVEAGGFDESFFIYFEDTDLVFRMRLAGHRCWYEPRAVVRHVGSATTATQGDLALYHMQRNMIWTWVRNMPLPLLLLYLPQHLLANVALLAIEAREGRAGIVLRAKRDAIAGLPRVLRERRVLQSRRQAGSRAILAPMSRGLDVAEIMPALRPLAARVRARRTPASRLPSAAS